MTLVRYCSHCREDFRLDILMCSDCGGPLVTRDDDDPLPAEAEPEPRLPGLRGEPVTLVGVERAIHLDPLVEKLALADIPSRVESAAGRFRLQVGEEDREEALALIVSLMHLVPALESAVVSGNHEAFDPETASYKECPACGTRLSGQPECPECGLTLAGERE